MAVIFKTLKQVFLRVYIYVCVSVLKEVVILNNLREQVVRLYNTDKFNVDHVNNIHKLTRVGNILRELSILPVSSYNLEN